MKSILIILIFICPVLANGQIDSLWFSPLKEISITSNFGTRKHPILGKIKAHRGIDLKATYDSVFTILPGIVDTVAYDAAAGIYIKVKHTDKMYSVYAHLSLVGVLVGDTLKGGQYIAISGNTGKSTTAPHLHFAITLSDKYINPKLYLSMLGLVRN